MVSRKALAALAMASLLGIAGRSWADVPAGPQASAPTQPLLLADDPAPRTPLMELLHSAGASNWLEQNNIRVFGYVEGGYTYNFDDPRGDVNVGRLFDLEHNELVLDQLDLTLEKTVDSKKSFDWGGRVEMIYGADAGFIHSNGLFDWYDAPRSPENQFDLNQAYVDLATSGFTIRAGKFVTLLGQEVINPTGNMFYSHSYLFNYTIPFTHTGVLVNYSFSDTLSVWGGITRGWDQSNEDINDTIDATGQVKWQVSKESALIFNFVTGPEINNDDWRTALNLILTCNPNDKWNFAIDSVFAWEDNTGKDGDTAYWYGVAGYAGYKLNDYVSINGRAEWFRDDDGTRVAILGRNGAAVAAAPDANYYEATIGLSVHPLAKDRWGQYLVLRPELRFDFSDEDVYNRGDDDSQVTFGIDAIYSF